MKNHPPLPFTLIDQDRELARTACRWRAEGALALDTEADSLYHYREKVCLIQLSTGSGDWLLDPLALKDLSPLVELCQDPRILKVLHGADYDVIGLRRDFGIQFQGLFDTQVAARFLGFPGVGLGDLLSDLFGIEQDKRYQRADWSRRPLPPQQLTYAVGDSHFLLPLRVRLLPCLEASGWLEAVRSESDAICQRRVGPGAAASPDGWRRLPGAGRLDPRAQWLLKALHRWREEAAANLDRPPFKVVSGHSLVALAQEDPATRQELAASRALSPRQQQRFGAGILRALEQARPKALVTPPPREPRGSAEAIPRLRGEEHGRYERLRSWRNRVHGTSGLEPALVAPNGALKRIAARHPTTIEELAQVPGLAPWRVKRFGVEILEVLGRG